MQKTKSLLQPEVFTVGKHLTLSSSSSLQNYAHPSSKEGTKSFASSSFKETEGIRVKLSLLKMPLVVVFRTANPFVEIIAGNEKRKKREKENEESEGFTRVQRDLRGWGGVRSKFLVELLSRKRNWTASLCQNWERVQAFQASSGWKKAGISYHLGFGRSRISKSLLRSIQWMDFHALVILVDLMMMMMMVFQ